MTHPIAHTRLPSRQQQGIAYDLCVDPELIVGIECAFCDRVEEVSEFAEIIPVGNDIESIEGEGRGADRYRAEEGVERGGTGGREFGGILVDVLGDSSCEVPDFDLVLPDWRSTYKPTNICMKWSIFSGNDSLPGTAMVASLLLSQL